MDAPSTSRRSLLGGCAAGLAAGCAALAGCVGIGGSGCSHGFDLTTTPATDEDLLEETLTGPSRDRPEDWRRIVSTAVERDEMRYAAIHAPPVRDGDRVEHGGRYYRIAREEVATEQVEAHVFGAEYETGRDPPQGATVVAFEDLPPVDRTAHRELFSDLGDRLDEVQSFSAGGYPVVYPDEAESDSVLVGEQATWILYDGAAVEVRFEGTERVERVTYRFTAEELAGDREAYLAYVRDRFVVELEGLSGGEREVFSRAIGAGEDGIKFCEPEGAERAVVERLEGIPESRTPGHGTWFVEYEGEVYLTELVEFET